MKQSTDQSSKRLEAPGSGVLGALREQPLVRIEPNQSWVTLNLRDVWAYRELLYFLTWRDVKVRYKQTLLGAAWAIIQPLFTMLIFTLFFGKLAGMPSDGIPYALFAYAGLLPWIFLSNAVTNSGNDPGYLMGEDHRGAVHAGAFPGFRPGQLVEGDRRRMHGHQHLTGARHRHRCLLDDQYLGTAAPVRPQCRH